MDQKQDPPTKILIVGEKLTGKTSIVQTFKEYDIGGNSSTAVTKSIDSIDNNNMGGNILNSINQDIANRNKLKQKMHVGVNQDFSLKILKIDGHKVRVQLWDQGSHMGAQATFQPLYIRNISGCIIVANSTNYKSMERAQRWKDYFDKKTKIPNEPNVPACLFINHDDMEKSAQLIPNLPNTPTHDRLQITSTPTYNKFKEVSDTDVLSANRVQEDDEFRSPERLDSQNDKNISKDEQKNKNDGQIIQENNQSQPSVDKFLNQYLQKYKTCIDNESIPKYEKLANIDSAGFFGTYHVSLGQPESICDSFENFITRIHNEKQRRRYDSSVSKLFADDTMRTKTCICRELMEHYNSDDQNQLLYNDQKGVRQNEKEFRQHHPHCPMRRNTGAKGNSNYYSSENDSIILRKLSKRRFDNQNRGSFQRNGANGDGKGGCC